MKPKYKFPPLYEEDLSTNLGLLVEGFQSLCTKGRVSCEGMVCEECICQNPAVIMNAEEYDEESMKEFLGTIYEVLVKSTKDK